MNIMESPYNPTIRIVTHERNRGSRKVERITSGIRYDFDDGRIRQVLCRIHHTLQSSHPETALNKRIDQIGQQLRTQRDFIALQVDKKLSGKHARHSRYAVGSGAIVPLYENHPPPEPLNCLFDSFVVRCDQHIRDRTTSCCPFIDMLNHRLPIQLHQRLAWETRGAVSGWNDDRDRLRGPSHDQVPRTTVLVSRLPSRPFPPQSQLHSSPRSRCS